jgi:hypothetical protein
MPCGCRRDDIVSYSTISIKLLNPFGGGSELEGGIEVGKYET